MCDKKTLQLQPPASTVDPWIHGADAKFPTICCLSRKDRKKNTSEQIIATCFSLLPAPSLYCGKRCVT